LYMPLQFRPLRHSGRWQKQKEGDFFQSRQWKTPIN
jgi:hypothetical protein